MNENNIKAILIGVASSLIAAILIYFIVPVLKKVGKWIIIKFENSNKNFRNKIIAKSAKKQSSHLGDINLISIISVTFILGIAMVVAEGTDLSSSFLKDQITSRVFGFSVMTFIFTFFSFRFLVRENISDKIKAFEYYLTILSEHLSRKEIAKLKSEWSKMRNEDDYKSITDKVSELLKKNVA